MTTSPVVLVTDELIVELDEACREHKLGFMIETAEVRALLAEREELKRDALRYRHIVPRLSHYAGGRTGVSMPSDYSTSTKEQCDAAIDEAMQS